MLVASYWVVFFCSYRELEFPFLESNMSTSQLLLNILGVGPASDSRLSEAGVKVQAEGPTTDCTGLLCCVIIKCSVSSLLVTCPAYCDRLT